MSNTNKKNDRLYVVVDATLPPGLKIAQSAHALAAFESEHPETYRDWHDTSNNLVVLQTLDLEELGGGLMERHGFKVSFFHEPDLNDRLTAIAVEPRAWKKLSNLRLAGWTERVKVYQTERRIEVPAPGLLDRLWKKLCIAA